MADVPGSFNDGLVRAIRAASSGQRMAQKKIAQKAGIHPTTLSGYLTDNYGIRTEMTIPAVEAIADALGMDVVALVTDAQKWRSGDWFSVPPS